MAFPTNDRPAILGGSPVRPSGPPDWPIPDDDVRIALDETYRTGAWGRYHSEHVDRLEQELAKYHGCEFALACSSGTFAVELALRALKVTTGDEVMLAAYDYGGNFLSVLAVGAVPVLVDVDAENWNMSPAGIDDAISEKTQAIIVSHLHGGVVPMSDVLAIARRRGVAVIEDAAQMPGALVEGRRAGTWGDVGTLSFGGSKLLTAGRGGAIITASREIHHRARLVCQRSSHPFPLSELQAAVLIPQLAKLDIRNDRRTYSVARLVAALRDLDGLRPLANAASVQGNTSPGYYKLGFQYDPASFGGLSRDRFVEAVRAEGIAFDAGFRALHVGRSPSRYRRVAELPIAEQAHAGMVVLHHPVLLGSDADIDEVANAVHKVARNAFEIETQHT
jgi:dTDP-4-amino-4,6-dideoxygalactose transaminase